MEITAQKYNNENIVNYLQHFYNNKESWAKAFVLKLFTAGILSTSQVESYNSKIKKLIFNSNTTILELVDKLTAYILEEDKKTEYTLFRASVPKTALVATADTILPNICKILRKYLTVEILKIQEDQIKQLLQYHAIIVTQSELQRYRAVNFNDPTIFENKSYTDIIAKAILNLVNKNNIVEINDSNHKPFLIAQKFETEQSVTISCDNLVSYLNALVQDTTGMGKARVALIVAVQRHNYNFITILDKYLNNCQEETSSNSESEIDSNNEVESDSTIKKGMLDPKELVNPCKRKRKGQPKGTDRMRHSGEPPKRAKRKLHCKVCGGIGHNRATCSQRQKS
ncbi:8930_t:CDS:2 [Scutellospora calospora]|uniref:8930_t:CDS:1 n=1 Tax=Scutellospora calospora TaxID=85575 RepID=A0ACA9KYT2_9GLOM|nr:8930_t:CDS:2 [Scutellospora calospora]